MATTKKKVAKKTVKAKKNAPQKNMVPLYILIIMALATALVMMINMQGGKFLPDTKDIKRGTAAKTETAADKDRKDAPVIPADTQDPSVIKKKVKVYFLTYNDRTKKVKPGSVIREVTGKDAMSEAVNELIKGLSEAEEDRGLINAMPEGMKLRSAAVKNGIAEFDFSSEFSENAHGDILTGRINQIFYTATQFPGVKGILIKMNGKPVKTVGGDGLMLSWPLTKEL